MAKRRLLVTGASGFVAEHLIPKLRSSGYFVIGVDRKDRPSAECDQFISCDLNGMIDDVGMVDTVIHMAAARADWGVKDDEFYSDNVDATHALLNYMQSKKISHLIFVSSISVMPQDTPDQLDESAPYAPINVYGHTKKQAEELCLSRLRTGELSDLTIVRPSVLYGPSDPSKTGLYRALDNNVFRLIDGVSSGRFAIVGSGKTVKTTAYVKNFVDALMFNLTHDEGYNLYVFADHPPTQTIELVKIIRSRLGKSGSGLKLPFSLVRHAATFLDVVARVAKINLPITAARIDTFTRPTNFYPRNYIERGFKPTHSTKQALFDTVDWYLELKSTAKINILSGFKDRGFK